MVKGMLQGVSKVQRSSESGSGRGREVVVINGMLGILLRGRLGGVAWSWGARTGTLDAALAAGFLPALHLTVFCRKYKTCEGK